MHLMYEQDEKSKMYEVFDAEDDGKVLAIFHREEYAKEYIKEKEEENGRI